MRSGEQLVGDALQCGGGAGNPPNFVPLAGGFAGVADDALKQLARSTRQAAE